MNFLVHLVLSGGTAALMAFVVSGRWRRQRTRLRSGWSNDRSTFTFRARLYLSGRIGRSSKGGCDVTCTPSAVVIYPWQARFEVMSVNRDDVAALISSSDGSFFLDVLGFRLRNGERHPAWVRPRGLGWRPLTKVKDVLMGMGWLEAPSHTVRDPLDVP